MSKKKFKYFRDPENFAYHVGEAKECSICKKKGIWLDGAYFHGNNEVECICDECLLVGEL